ncbi:hypothetical protein HJG60_011059 [Phyllostomus discolor]|uniref:Uncharacterized protein n=1 Tax=Phyllostomus discolor TaxID=89673 RepID=A0A834AE32_9CHIR|nr:hypothetical protein HJG60_011059 [Phyllostomus discolor]
MTFFLHSKSQGIYKIYTIRFLKPYASALKLQGTRRTRKKRPQFCTLITNTWKPKLKTLQPCTAAPKKMRFFPVRFPKRVRDRHAANHNTPIGETKAALVTERGTASLPHRRPGAARPPLPPSASKVQCGSCQSHSDRPHRHR